MGRNQKKQVIKLLKGNILNVFTGDIYPAEIIIQDGMIKVVRKIQGNFDGILLPGFIDSHVHIESSLMTPSSFAEATIPHGTTAVISDPHEIANVMGIEGIDFMIEDSKRVPLKFFFHSTIMCTRNRIRNSRCEDRNRGNKSAASKG